jgi:hypothetical protein
MYPTYIEFTEALPHLLKRGLEMRSTRSIFKPLTPFLGFSIVKSRPKLMIYVTYILVFAFKTGVEYGYR